MFERIQALPADPILGVLALFRADASPHKVDLGVGVYRDEFGKTPVFEAVRQAEQAVIAEQQTKAYLGASGNETFNALVTKLVLGNDHPAIRDARVRTIQTPGGCGALRVGAELIASSAPGAAVHISTPTWANHAPLVGGARLQLEHYPYYDARTSGVNFSALMDKLSQAPSGSVVLLQGACHNPTGADLSAHEWEQAAKLLSDRGLVPFVDLAYQGLGDGLDRDALGARVLAQAVPDMLIAISGSKNFGLYRERVGALIAIAGNSGQAEAAATHIRRIARGIYSMPPDHGAAIVVRILESPALMQLWKAELDRMRERIGELRRAFAGAVSKYSDSADLSALAQHRGMFSLLNLPRGGVERLRTEHHVYMTDDGRINVAGLGHDILDQVARAVADVMDRGDR